MKTIRIEIPEDKAEALAQFLEARNFPDDDGRSEVRLMEQLDYSVAQFVALERVYDDLLKALKEAA